MRLNNNFNELKVYIYTGINMIYTDNDVIEQHNELSIKQLLVEDVEDTGNHQEGHQKSHADTNEQACISTALLKKRKHQSIIMAILTNRL